MIPRPDLKYAPKAKIRYRPEIGEVIANEVAKGKSIKTIERMPDMPCGTTIFKWIREYPEFRLLWEKAKEDAADMLVEDMLEIADDTGSDFIQITKPNGEVKTVVDHENIQRSRLRVDTRKWIAAKLKPKRYGENIQLGGDVEIKHRLVIQDE